MKSVLVLGASRGLGLELVHQYCEAGCRVIATVRDAAGRERVQALGAEVLTIDLANPTSVSGLRATLASVTAADQGRLLHHDGRRAAHW